MHRLFSKACHPFFGGQKKGTIHEIKRKDQEAAQGNFCLGAMRGFYLRTSWIKRRASFANFHVNTGFSQRMTMVMQ